MINLKAEYGNTYRITIDESATIPDQPRDEMLWCYQIPGRLSRSHIGVWGENTLSAYAEGPLTKKLAAHPGVKVVQRGDREVQVTFPPKMIHEIAGLIKARKRRHLSPEHREKLAAASIPHRFHGSNGENPGLDSTQGDPDVPTTEDNAEIAPESNLLGCCEGDPELAIDCEPYPNSRETA